MSEGKNRTLTERYPEFNPDDFRDGNLVSFYQDGGWITGALIGKPKIREGKIFITTIRNPEGIELCAPPKKIELPTIGKVALNGKEYTFNPNRFYMDENGNPLLDLTDTVTGKRMLGVDAAILREYEFAADKIVEKSDVSEDVKKVAGMKRKELLVEQQKLEKKFEELMAKFGSPDEWVDFDAKEIRELKDAISKIGKEVDQLSLVLRREVDTLVSGKKKEAREQVAQATAHLKYLEDLEVMDEGVSKDDTAFRFYDKDLTADNVIKKEVERRRQEKAKELNLKDDDFPSGKIDGDEDEKRKARVYRKRTVEIFRQVLSEWKGQKVDKEAKFDFEKEKIDLEDKVIALRDEAAKYRDLNIDKKIKRLEDIILLADEGKVTTIHHFLTAWQLAGEIEVDLYSKELTQGSHKEREVKEREIDVSQKLWAKILDRRNGEMKEVLKTAYASLKEDGSVDKVAVRRALKRLFKEAPPENILRELLSCGIKSWDSFLTRLDGQFGETLSSALAEMAQDHLRREVAKNVGFFDRFDAKSGQVFLRATTNVVLVGGTATLLMALTSGPEMARWANDGDIVRRVTGGIGGALGGIASGFVDRLAWWRKGPKDDMAKQMAELEAKKRKEISADLVTNFGVEEFAAVMAQLTREVSAKPLVETESEEAKRLDVNARHVYIDALKTLEMAGEEVNAEQKCKLAIALLELQAITKQKADMALAESDPVFARMFTGDDKIYSGQLADERTALTTCAVHGALVGLGLSGDWLAWAGGVLGGATGYAQGEKGRKQAKEHEGAKNVEVDFKTITEFHSLRSAFESAKPRLVQLEEEFESVREPWESLSSELGRERRKLSRFEDDLNTVLREVKQSKFVLREMEAKPSGYDESVKEEVRKEIKKGEEKKSQIQEKIESAKEQVWSLEREIEPLEDLRKQIKTINDMGQKIIDDKGKVAGLILKFKAALRGGQMKEVKGEGGARVKKQVDEQWYVMALQNNPVLRAQVENLVYEAEKNGDLLIEQNKKEDLNLLLQKLAERSRELEEQSKSLSAGGGQWKTGLYAAIGVGAGAALAWLGSKAAGSFIRK